MTARPPTQIVEYVRVEGSRTSFAVAEYTDNTTLFSCREPDELRWHPFTPSSPERAAVDGLRARGPRDGSMQTINLNEFNLGMTEHMASARIPSLKP
jgi:hypothetical protein